MIPAILNFSASRFRERLTLAVGGVRKRRKATKSLDDRQNSSLIHLNALSKAKPVKRISAARLCIVVAAVFLVGFGKLHGQSNPEYSKLIHLGDLVDVDVVGSTEYDWRGTLSPEGFLDGLDQLPKQVFALCRSEEDVAAEIAAEYGRILRDPKVVVRVLDRSNRAIARMDGAIKTPHRFRIQRRVLLNELIVMAGGITDAASGEIRILRPQDLSCRGRSGGTIENGRPNIVTVKIADILKGDSAANPVIVSGDIVTILEAYPIYVIGGVNRPGTVDSRSKVTLTRAIAMSGGLIKNAEKKSIAIYRREGGKQSIINVDLSSVEGGGTEDPVLKPFDIVDISERGSRPRRLPPDPDLLGRRMSNVLTQPPLKVVD